MTKAKGVKNDKAAEENEDVKSSEEEEGKPKRSKKKLFIIVIAIVVLLIAGGAGYFVLSQNDLEGADNAEVKEKSNKDSKEEHNDQKEHDKKDHGDNPDVDSQEKGVEPETPAASTKPVYIVLKDSIVTNLKSSDPSGKKKFVKISVALQMKSGTKPEIVVEANPKIRDLLNSYIAGLTEEDVKGVEGMYRLKEEILLRLNMEVFLDKIVEEVLITDIVVN